VTENIKIAPLWLTNFTLAPSPAFSVFTPQSIRSPTPEPKFAARSPRSMSSGLNFQALSLSDPKSSGPSDLLPTISEEVTTDTNASQSYLSRASQFTIEDVEGVIDNHYENSQHNLSALGDQARATIDKLQDPPVSSDTTIAAWPPAAEESAESRLTPGKSTKEIAGKLSTLRDGSDEDVRFTMPSRSPLPLRRQNSLSHFYRTGFHHLRGEYYEYTWGCVRNIYSCSSLTN